MKYLADRRCIMTWLRFPMKNLKSMSGYPGSWLHYSYDSSGATLILRLGVAKSEVFKELCK